MNEYNPFSYIIGGCCDSCFGCYRRALFEISTALLVGRQVLLAYDEAHVGCVSISHVARNAYMDVSLQATPFDRASKHVNGILTMEHEARQVHFKQI